MPRRARSVSKAGVQTIPALHYLRMALIDSNHQRAAILLLLLGAALVIALSPYGTGLIGIPVLYAVFAPVHEWVGMRMRPQLAASLVVVLALFLRVVPGVEWEGLLGGPAQGAAG